jgi:hypothetical protein
VLKKRGLLTGKTQSGGKIDARSADPRWKIGKQTLGSIVKRNAALIDSLESGKASLIKVPAPLAAKLRRKGYSTVKGAVIVPHSQGEKATLRKGEIVRVNTSGLERVTIDTPILKAEDYLRKLRADQKKLNAMKRRGEYFGIRFHGNHRATVYATIDLLLEDLEKYEAFVSPGGREKQKETIQALEIVSLNKAAMRRWFDQAENRKRGRSREYNRRQAKKFRQRLKTRASQERRDRYNEKAAERMKAYRERLKKDKKRYSAYKRAAKKRLKKSRKDKK